MKEMLIRLFPQAGTAGMRERLRGGELYQRLPEVKVSQGKQVGATKLPLELLARNSSKEPHLLCVKARQNTTIPLFKKMNNNCFILPRLNETETTH